MIIMKKLLFLLFVSSFAYSQQGVEIRLVNPNVGTPQCNYFFNDWMCNTTNDAGLNTIFNNYGVNYFKVKGGHPYYTNTTIMAIQGDYPPQFVSDLATYSTVVAAAKFWNTNTFSDVLILTLTNSLIGMPIGVSGNIILTKILA